MEEFEFTLHDLVPKDREVVFKDEKEYKRGIIY